MIRQMKVWLPAIKGGSGADVHTRRLADALERRRVSATISWFSTYFQFAPFALSRVSPPPNVNIVHALSWSGFAFKRHHLPLLVSEQLDVLDRTYRPYKSTAQALFHRTMVRRFMKKSFAAASAVTAVSRATAISLAQTVNVRSVEVIPNFVDTAVFRPRSGAAPKPSKSFRLLFIGNLTKRKGADLLAPIMKQLGSRFELRLTTGLRDGRVGEMAPNMISIGKLNTDQELIAAYHNCDALLFPSRLEGLPIAPLEAMACAKPIIAANVSSLPELVVNAVTGILCEPNNVAQFVTACQQLADSPDRQRQFGAAARQRVEEIFSEAVVVPQYVALYERLVSSRNS
jgi:glycosyltransferase involved in cell wall biosynthesis